MLAVTADGAWVVSTPKLAPTFTGSGDITSAAFLASYLELRSVPEALAKTAASCTRCSRSPPSPDIASSASL
jgi:pyridoxine kinase